LASINPDMFLHISVIYRASTKITDNKIITPNEVLTAIALIIKTLKS
jgi:hypothetical protein